VSDQKLDRFRRLERPRAAGADPAPRSPSTDTRIEAVEGPGPAGPATAGPAAGGELGRFRAPPERGLELDTAAHDAQPFLRCAGCETDNFRTAAACSTCGADLDTEPQRLFNQRFWAGRRAEAAAEAEASAALQAELALARAGEEAQRRSAAEAMALLVGDAERRRLEQEGFGGDWSRRIDLVQPGAPSASRAFRWLSSLPRGWAVGIGLALLALPFLLYLVRPSLGLVTGLVLLTLFAPPRWRPRLRNRPWS
jgi:hypothetical protein